MVTHRGAREYDPTIGQFISVDPLLSPDQHQSLNGCSYAGNTPVTQSDPTGLCFADACGVGTPKGDGSGNIITDGPIDPNSPSAGSCHHGSCGRVHYNQTGTASTSSSGNVSSDSGASNRCARTGLPQDCGAPVKGPSDSNSYVGNYLSSLGQNGDFFEGLLQSVLGGASEGGGVILGASGVVECATGVLCEAGVPSIAGGAGLVVFGDKMLDSGSDKLGKAFREADSDTSRGRRQQLSGDAYEDSLYLGSHRNRRLLHGVVWRGKTLARPEGGYRLSQGCRRLRRLRVVSRKDSSCS
ncbi:RHS repeat-associated core domain-containing protein [Streptomyces sp. 2231.1]|uniref:RHS repeat-associated core domain-containing protein n=1 Tax=Streptomyces sp. 2231.1 TaxID=1855347 RepID=UPI000B8354E9|nr:RHS repeat-associated core domain-containing protein [Streptomyces sp. 2231.1]